MFIVVQTPVAVGALVLPAIDTPCMAMLIYMSMLVSITFDSLPINHDLREQISMTQLLLQ